MNKKLLRTIPFDKPRSSWLEMTYQASDATYFMSARIKIIDHHKTLILDIYTKADLLQLSKPSYRLFLTKDDDITLTFKAGKIKWLTGRLFTILNLQWWRLGETAKWFF